MALLDTGDGIEIIPSEKYSSYYHPTCVIQPLPLSLVRDLINAGLFDPQHDKTQGGLLQLYHDILTAPVKGPHPVLRLSVCKLADQLIGVLAVHPRDKDDICLTQVYVDPCHRGKGIATRLLQQALSLPTLPTLRMVVTETNRQFLRKHPAIFREFPPTELDREVQQCLRTLDPKNNWVLLDSEGKAKAELINGDVRALIQRLHQRVKDSEVNDL